MRAKAYSRRIRRSPIVGAALGLLAGLAIFFTLTADATSTVSVTLRAGTPPPAPAIPSLITDDTFANNLTNLDLLNPGDSRIAYLDAGAFSDFTVQMTIGDIVVDNASLSIALPLSGTIAGQSAEALLVAQWADGSSVVPVVSLGVKFTDLDLMTFSDAWTLPTDAPDPVFPETWINVSSAMLDLSPFSEAAPGDAPVDLEVLETGATTTLEFFPDGFEAVDPGVAYQSSLVLGSAIGDEAAEGLGYLPSDDPTPTLVDLEATIVTTAAILDGDLADTAFSATAVIPEATDPIAGFLRASSDWTLTFDHTVPASPGNASFSEATDLWTFAGHGLSIGDTVTFLAGGTDASPYAADTEYFVIDVPDGDTFQLSETDGGAFLDGTTDSGTDWPIAPDPNPFEFGFSGQVEPYDDPATTTEDPKALTGLPAVNLSGVVSYTAPDTASMVLLGDFDPSQCTTPPFPGSAMSCWKDALGKSWLDLSEVEFGLEFGLEGGVGSATATLAATLDVDEDSGPLNPFAMTAEFGYVDGTPPTISAEFTVATEISIEQVAGLYLSQGTAAAASPPGQDTLTITEASFFASTAGDETKFALTGQIEIFDDVTVNGLVALTQVDGEDLLLLGIKTDGLSFTDTFDGLFTGPNNFEGSVLGEITMPEVIYTFAFPQGSPSTITAPYDIPIDDLGTKAQEFFELTGPGAELHLGGTFSIEGSVDLADLGSDVLDTFGIVPVGGEAIVEYTGTANASFDWGGGNGGGFTLDSLELTAALPGASLTLPTWLQAQLLSDAAAGARVEDLFLRFEYDGSESTAEIRANLFADLDDRGTAGTPSIESVAVSGKLTYDGSMYEVSGRGEIQQEWDDDGDLTGPGDWQDPFGVSITLSDAYIAFTYASGPPVTATATVGGTIPVGTATLDATAEIMVEGSTLAADFTLVLEGATTVPVDDIIDLAEKVYAQSCSPLPASQCRPLAALARSVPAPPPFPGDLSIVRSQIEALEFGPGIIKLHVGDHPTLLAAARTVYYIEEGTASEIAVPADGLLQVNEDLEFLAGVRLDRTDLTLGEIAADFGPVLVAGSVLPPPVLLPPVDDFVVPEVTLVVANAEVDKASDDLETPVFDFFKHLYGCTGLDVGTCPDFDLAIDPGATLLSAVYLPDSLLDALEVLSIRDDPVLLKGFLPLFGSTLEPFFEAQLPEIVPDDAVTDPNYWLRKIQLAFRVGTNSFSFAGTTTVKFDDDQLDLRLAMTADTAGRSLQLSASLDGTGGASGTWTTPFGIEWLNVRGLAVELGIAPKPLPTSPTYGIEVGLFGAVDIGSRDFSGSVLVTIPASGVPIFEGVRAASAAGLSTQDLIDFQAAVAASLVDPDPPAISFGGLPGVAVRNVEFQYSTQDRASLCLVQGVVLKGDLYLNQGDDPGSLIVNALPATGSPGQIVKLTTDDKLYRWTGSGWAEVDLNGPCQSIPDRPNQSDYCRENSAQGCFASVRLKINENTIEAAGGLGRFRMGACDPFGSAPDTGCVLVFEGAQVDLKVGRDGAGLADRLVLSGRARVPTPIPGFPVLLEGQVNLEIRATLRAFMGDFKIYGLSNGRALVDATVGVVNGLPFDPSAAGFTINAQFRADFLSGIAAEVEPILTEIRRVFGVVSGIVTDLNSGDPAVVLGNLAGRLDQLGITVPDELADVAAAVVDFNTALQAAFAPFNAFNAVADEFGLDGISLPTAPTPTAIVDLALQGYTWPAAFTISPPSVPPVQFCIPFTDECTPPACPPLTVASGGSCYIGTAPFTPPAIPGLCDAVGFLPAGAECSFKGLFLSLLDEPMRQVLGGFAGIDIVSGLYTSASNDPRVPPASTSGALSLTTAINKLTTFFTEPATPTDLFNVECAQLTASVNDLQASNTAALGFNATVLGNHFGDTLFWDFDDLPGSAFNLAKQVLEIAFGVRQPQPPTCAALAPEGSPRALALTVAPTTLDEGSTVALVGVFEADEDDHTVTVDWGDGTVQTLPTLTGGARILSATHTYADDVAPVDAGGTRPEGTPSDIYTIAVTVTHAETGSISKTQSVTVNNVAPVLTANPNVTSILEHQWVTITGNVSDVGVLDTHTLVIDWKDGAPVTVPIAANGDYIAMHRYRDDNPTATASDVYDVSVTVVDDDSGTTSLQVPITVNNVAPTLLTLETYPLLLDDNGVYVQSPTEGTTIDESEWILVEGEFSDPGTQDSHVVVIEWNDDAGDLLVLDDNDEQVQLSGTTTTTYEVPAGQYGFSLRHRFYDDDPSGTASDVYPVSVTVIDDDTGSDDDAFSVTVNNVAPSDVELTFGLLVIDENDVLEMRGTFRDQGIVDVHTALIDWGDGSPPEQLVVSPPAVAVPGDAAAQREFVIRHRFLDDDPPGTPSDQYEISLILSDDDLGVSAPATTRYVVATVGPGGVVTTTEVTGVSPALVTVRDVVPTVELDITPRIDENDIAVLDGTIFDPGTLDGWGIVIDWGEGSPLDSFAIEDGRLAPLTATGNFVGASRQLVTGPNIDQDTGELEIIGVLWSFQWVHQYIDDNPTRTPTDIYTVTATVVDDDTLIGVGTDTIIVDNVLPSIDAGGDHFVFEDDLVVLDPATFRDIGTADTHTASIDWGDGTEVAPVAVTEYDGPLGNLLGADGTLDASHRYATPGIYRATLCIVDDDEPHNPVCDTFVVTVVNGFFKFAGFAEDHKGEVKKDVTVIGSVGGTDDLKIDKDTAVSGSVISVNGDVKIEDRSTVGGSIVSGNDVELDKHVVVAGTVDADRHAKIDDSASVGGLTIGPAAYQFPPVEWVDFDFDGNHDDRKTRGVTTLDPGTYGDVRIDKGTLVLSGGVYRMESLRADGGTELHIDLAPGETIVIELEDEVYFGSNVEMRLVGAGSPDDVLVLVDGKKIKLGDRGTYLGTFIGEEADAKLGHGATLVGGLYGRKLKIENHAQITADPAMALFASHRFAFSPVDTVLFTVEAGVDRFVFEDDLVVLDPARFYNLDRPVDHTATIDWGDGTVDTVAVVPVPGASLNDPDGVIPGSHVFTEPGEYVVSICVSSAVEPACQLDTLVVTVVNGFLRFATFADHNKTDIGKGAAVVGSVGGVEDVKVDRDASISGDVISVEGDADLDDRSTVGGDVVSGRDATVDRDATVAGDLDAARKAKIDGTVNGAVTIGVAATRFPDVRWLEFDAAGGELDLKTRGTTTLVPSIYGDVRVDWGTLVLDAGVYRFRSLKADDGAVIEIRLDGDETIVLEVEREVDLGKRVEIRIVGSGDASNVLVLVAEGKVDLDDDGSYVGTFVATTGKAKLGKDASLVGALFGRSVKVEDRAFILGDPASALFADQRIMNRHDED